MNKDLLNELNIDDNFLSFINEMYSPVVIFDENLNVIWYNRSYNDYKNSLPVLSKVDKNKFQKIKSSNSVTGYIYKYDLEILKKVKSIAHDFNNILSTIINSTEALKIKLESRDDLFPYLNTIENNAHRAAEITEELLPSTRIGDRRKKINSEKLITEVVEAIRQTFPKNITIKADLGDFNPNILCNQADIYRSLLNICINAKEAIEGDGEISITLSRFDDNFLEIKISDSGSGISIESLSKIFTPGFSTKQKNRESGLGLNIVREIIENHNGRITAESTLGEGTTFNVYLPYISKTVVEKSRSGSISSILLADDEEILRELLAELLEANDYKVFQAGDGNETINIFKSEKIDLLIIDRKMPNLSGLDCIKEIREINPNVPIILASGSQPEEYKDIIQKLKIDKILNKPYDFDQMKIIIEELD